MATALHVLHRYSAGNATAPRQAGCRQPRLWPLLPLFWIWANTHSLYVVGWGILVCFVAGTWLQRRRFDRRLALWSAAAIAAALANPYGPAGIGQSLSLATRLRGGVFGAGISEYLARPSRRSLCRSSGSTCCRRSVPFCTCRACCSRLSACGECGNTPRFSSAFLSVPLGLAMT